MVRRHIENCRDVRRGPPRRRQRPSCRPERPPRSGPTATLRHFVHRSQHASQGDKRNREARRHVVGRHAPEGNRGNRILGSAQVGQISLCPGARFANQPRDGSVHSEPSGEPFVISISALRWVDRRRMTIKAAATDNATATTGTTTFGPIGMATID